MGRIDKLPAAALSGVRWGATRRNALRQQWKTARTGAIASNRVNRP